MVNQAVEEAIVRALRSPAVIRAIERAIESGVTTERSTEEITLLLKRVLASQVADQAWAEILASDQAQQLVERIARAPEIRAAIASQGAGLITDMGIRLTVITEHFDHALERVFRRREADAESHQAGLATRSVAAAVDLALWFAGCALIASVVSSLFRGVSGERASLPWLIAGWTILAIGAGASFAAFWSLAGQTPGMRFLSIRLISCDSAHITYARAIRREFAAVLSLLPLGLGYVAILHDPSRRAWHDRLTNTEVVYDLAARTAPHAVTRDTSAADARYRPRRS